MRNREQTHMELMVEEINAHIKPVTVMVGKMQITLTKNDARCFGPERVKISHNKNSTTLGEIFPDFFNSDELKALVGA